MSRDWPVMAKERSQGSVTQGTQNTRAAVAAARDPQFKNNCHSDIPCRSYGYQLATIRLCQHEFSLEESAFRAVSQVSGQCSEQTGQPLNRVWDSRESLASYGQGGGSIGSNPGITSILDPAAFLNTHLSGTEEPVTSNLANRHIACAKKERSTPGLATIRESPNNWDFIAHSLVDSNCRTGHTIRGTSFLFFNQKRNEAAGWQSMGAVCVHCVYWHFLFSWQS